MTVFIKICGITRFEDAECAIANGVSALGFIAYPPSPRHISPENFSKIAQQIKALDKAIKVELVIVMVNPSIEDVESYLEAGADIIQLHGKESSEFVNSLECRCWKAFNIKSKQQVEELKTYKVERYLIDSFVKDAKIPGGTGHTADWELSKFAVKELPAPVILAGGITPQNIVEAWNTVKPYGFDLSSGVEVSPGIKSHQRIEELFKTVSKLQS